MANASDIYGTAYKNSSVTFLARIVDKDNDLVLQADLSSIAYTVYLLDEDDADVRTAVTCHSAVTLAVADTIFDTLQTDDTWTEDTTGYNFRHILDVAAYEAFAIAGRNYQIEYTLTPVSGQKITVRFRMNVI
jgi:hypothetical protein